MMNTNVKIDFTLKIQMLRLNKSNTAFYVNTKLKFCIIHDDRQIL